MAAPISFVIPVLNEAERVAPLLEELRERYPLAELVVVDGGSRDGTVAAAMRLCDSLLVSPAGRARQMNLGGRAATGDYLFFLHADTSLSVSAGALAEALAAGPHWGFFRVSLSGAGISLRVVEWCMNRRSGLTRVATGDQVLFLNRALFETTGGFADIPLMEDVEYCKRLRGLAAPSIIPQPVTTSSRRWEERGVARTVLQMWWLRLAFAMGASPGRLHRIYYGG
jgi:rSAM/selenodomain-associated transferase 2